MLISFAIGMANYVNTFVAQYEGAGLKHRVSASGSSRLQGPQLFQFFQLF